MTAGPTTNDGLPTMSEQPQVLVFGSDGENRRLLAETLGNSYQVETTDEPAALHGQFDCCLVTEQRFPDVAELLERRCTETDVFLPAVLLSEDGDVDPAVWEYVDDVVTLPVKKAALHARMENLLERRRTACELAERERELRETVDDLRLKEQAIDEAPVGFSIADARRPDNPLIYVNDQFLQTTGYDATEVLDRNCRFLQGEETDTATVDQLREGIDAKQPVSVDIVNYRKNGEKFWNSVDVAPLRNTAGDVTHYVGFQTDVTKRKVRERRQEVLNRVLSHNLRNKMNVIEAYLEILNHDAVGDPPAELTEIGSAVQNLLALAETARETDRILSETDSDRKVDALDQRLRELADAIRDQYPDVTVSLTLPDEPIRPVATGGLLAALEEALDNAAKHNDNDNPRVCIRVENRDDNWVSIEIEDNGPGIPQQELDVLKQGEEALQHADRMGIWLIYWTVTRAGGSMTVSNCESDGTVVELAVPTVGEL
ncbi:PAS domain-containing protein [Salinibaculum rarum]|uniref:PAS domain-containing protein n=1 Tax=Salinibaculum rarum TaxID=3058903 RepID=UPI00265E275F|nr:PAS domain-containing protein [Salinibaculum sp. KK48]